VADGVPFGSARKVVETPDGALYVLARERVVRFDPSPLPGGKAFSPLASPELARSVGEVFDLAVAPDGALVLVGTKGAARLRGGALRPLDLGPLLRPDPDDPEMAWAAAFDASGALWVARSFSVTRIAPGGGRTTWPVPSGQVIGSGWGWLPSMVADRRRGVWVQALTELWHLTADPSGKPVREEVIDRRAGFPSIIIRALHETASGVLWIATPDRGLVRCEGAPGARRFTTIGTREGLPDSEVTALASDTQENLWVGTGVAGLVRVAAEGMTSWGAADGLLPVTVQALHDDPEEGLLVIMADLHFNSMKGGRIVHRWTPAPPLVPNWGEKQLVARGRDGRLWLATGAGLAMFPPGTNVREFATRQPERLFDTSNGLPGNEIQRLFVASDGTVWFGILHADKGLCRMDGQGDGLRCFDERDGLPPEAAAVAFGEDLDGGIWFGLWEGGLFRHREGRIESWPETAESVQTRVASIRRDASGALWVSGAPGLLRVEDAASPHPRFRRLTAEQGISSPETTDTAEDAAGRLYVGGAHGVARVDLATGAARRFTVADGLPSNRVTAMQWDARGALWIGTSRGVARLVPRAGASHGPAARVPHGRDRGGDTARPPGSADARGRRAHDRVRLHLPQLPGRPRPCASSGVSWTRPMPGARPARRARWSSPVSRRGGIASRSGRWTARARCPRRWPRSSPSVLPCGCAAGSSGLVALTLAGVHRGRPSGTGAAPSGGWSGYARGSPPTSTTTWGRACLRSRS
jgi:sugar lactone lactonase YvrE